MIDRKNALALLETIRTWTEGSRELRLARQVAREARTLEPMVASGIATSQGVAKVAEEIGKNSTILGTKLYQTSVVALTYLKNQHFQALEAIGADSDLADSAQAIKDNLVREIEGLALRQMRAYAAMSDVIIAVAGTRMGLNITEDDDYSSN